MFSIDDPDQYSGQIIIWLSVGYHWRQNSSPTWMFNSWRMDVWNTCKQRRITKHLSTSTKDVDAKRLILKFSHENTLRGDLVLKKTRYVNSEPLVSWKLKAFEETRIMLTRSSPGRTEGILYAQMSSNNLVGPLFHRDQLVHATLLQFLSKILSSCRPVYPIYPSVRSRWQLFTTDYLHCQFLNLHILSAMSQIFE